MQEKSLITQKAQSSKFIFNLDLKEHFLNRCAGMQTPAAFFLLSMPNFSYLFNFFSSLFPLLWFHLGFSDYEQCLCSFNSTRLAEYQKTP